MPSTLCFVHSLTRRGAAVVAAAVALTHSYSPSCHYASLKLPVAPSKHHLICITNNRSQCTVYMLIQCSTGAALPIRELLRDRINNSTAGWCVFTASASAICGHLKERVLNSIYWRVIDREAVDNDVMTTVWSWQCNGVPKTCAADQTGWFGRRCWWQLLYFVQ